MDLIEAFSDDEQARHENVQDFFMNCSHILEELSQYEEQMHHVLRYIGAQYQIQPLSQCVAAGVCITAATCGTIVHGKNKTVEFLQWAVGCDTTVEGPQQRRLPLIFDGRHTKEYPPLLKSHHIKSLKVGAH